MLGALFFQLSRGPISLSFLTPVVERTLNSALDGASVKLHDTILAWEGPNRALDIRAIGLQVLGTDGAVQATVPEMAVTFSARALLRGLIAPTRLELLGPRMQAVREADGKISIGFGDGATDGGGGQAASDLVGELLRPPNPDLASGYLSQISVLSALIEFEDRVAGRTFVVSRVNITLSRDDEGVRADGSVVVGEGESAIHLGLSGVHRAKSRTTDLGLVFSDLSPSALVPFDGALAMLDRLEARLDGTLTLELDPAMTPLSASVDLRMGAGTLDAAPSLELPVRFDGAALRINAGRGLDQVSVEKFEVDLGETVVGMAADAQRADGVWRISLEGGLRDLPVDDIDLYWPPAFEDSAHEWVTENIEDGRIDSLSFRARAEVSETDPQNFTVDGIGGDMQFREATVHYLRPLEPITGGAGNIVFDAEKLEIEVTQARLRDIVAEKGSVVIAGLSGPPRGETIKIEATVAGPVRDALEILDGEPLGFISDFGIDPATTSGTQRTNAVFAFPLLDEIKVDEIAVATTSRLTSFSAAEAAFGLPVSEGDLTLMVNREGLEASGTAKIDGIPLDLTWLERFNDDGEVRTRYEVRATLDEAARARLDVATAPYLEGPIGLGLTFSVGWDGVSAGAAEIDLTESALSLEPFDWRKPAGIEGRAFVRFHASDDSFLTVPEIMIEAADLRASGAATFRLGEDTFALQQLRFSDLRFGETAVALAVDMSESGVPDIALSGVSLDARALVDELLSDDDETDGEDTTPPMRIRVSDQSPIGSIRLGEETRLQGAHGVLENDGTDWSNVLLRGDLSNAGRIFVEVVPDGAVRRLRVETDDAGGLLRALDWVDTIRDGDLRVVGVFEGTGKDEVLTGQVDSQGFVLTEEPFAAKVLALASFSGIGDVLGGDGITFRRAEIPFRLTETEILIEDAKARGAEIGIIASGRIDRVADTIDMEGEIAPAYTLNSLLANIPLIGQVLSGGSEGIFAATFGVDGSLDDPNVSVNPLSVLTPGIIRRLLSGFSGEGGEDGEILPDPEQPEIGQ